MNYKHVDRVIKLEELADPIRGGTEGEQAAARDRASFLRRKYEISDRLVEIRRSVLHPPIRRRRTWVPDPPPSAANVARRHGLDAKAFRRWLRAKGITSANYDVHFATPEMIGRLVSEFHKR